MISTIPTIPTHRPPSACPVCSTALITLRLGCPACGTELSGHFSSCRYCRLDAADQELLEVFLRGRGNVRDIQSHLEVSYPTARARLQEVLDKLGLNPDEATPSEPEAATPGLRLLDVEAQSVPISPSPAAMDDRLVAAVLAELAAGSIDVTAAEALISRLA